MVSKWIRGLWKLSLLADEALANRILEAERLKSAELRLQLMEREDRHMCLSPGCRNAEHPSVTQAKRAIEARDTELAKENGLRKEKALADARDLLDKAHALELERRAFVPEKLRRRIKENNSAQQEAIGWRLDDNHG